MRNKVLLFIFIAFISCKNLPKSDSSELDAISVKKTTFKVLDSHYIDNNKLWKPFEKSLNYFSEKDYNRLKFLVLGKDILSIQQSVFEGKLTYEQLTLFYLYRIKKYDRNNDLSLNSVISLNPKVIEQAREKDRLLKITSNKHPIFGMPILLKDNINATDMPTTAGAVALENNFATDAFIVQKLKENGALILGKANLSEWAYFFCADCPSGYSAIGGQTLNPYGRKLFDTGGSSSGSAVATAVNFAVAAVGTETAGSILSPSSQNSVVGLKPIVGLLSRTGIVPISSTLDTPGPITKNVIDNAILFSAMVGFDKEDASSLNVSINKNTFFNSLVKNDDFLIKKRLGVFKELLKDSLYAKAVATLKKYGVQIIEIIHKDTDLDGFLTLLNIDMRNDLPIYLSKQGAKDLAFTSVNDIINFNKKDSVNTMPYGQALFYGIVTDKTSKDDFNKIKKSLKTNGKMFFDQYIEQYNLDAILSVNNYHAAEAAVAKYPAITVPMGYQNGEPKGLTFISSKGVQNILNLAYAYEQLSKHRKLPENYN